MKNRRYLVVVIILAVVAIGWRISHPPKPPIPGPLGSPPQWRASNVIGVFAGMQLNADNSQAAAVWAKRYGDNRFESGLRIIDINNMQQSAVRLPDGYEAIATGWLQDTVYVMSRKLGNQTVISEVDRNKLTVTDKATIADRIEGVLSWPADSQCILCASARNNATTLSSCSLSGGLIGKTITIPDSQFSKWDQASAISRDGRWAVASLIGKDSVYPSYYYCDMNSGKRHAFAGGHDLPGRVLDIYVGEKGVLLFCIAADQIKLAYYDVTAQKLQSLTSAPLKWSPETIWPDSPMEAVYFTSKCATKVDVRTLSITPIFDLQKVEKSNPGLRSQIRGAKGKLLPNGDILSVITEGGQVDIRRFTKDGRQVIPILVP